MAQGQIGFQETKFGSGSKSESMSPTNAAKTEKASETAGDKVIEYAGDDENRETKLK